MSTGAYARFSRQARPGSGSYRLANQSQVSMSWRHAQCHHSTVNPVCKAFLSRKRFKRILFDILKDSCSLLMPAGKRVAQDSVPEDLPALPARRRERQRLQRPINPNELAIHGGQKEVQLSANRAGITDVAAEVVHEDDLCPICQLVICEPVITVCRHTLCRSCMAHWADVSLSQPMAIVPVSEEAVDFDAVSGLEARCPLCRTQTTACQDEERRMQLKMRYPQAYAERELEERETNEGGESIQTMTLYIGNRHRLTTPSEDSPQNNHEWAFFIKPSRTEIIEEVQIFLHPTFRPSRIVRQRAPYEIRRLGWGIFAIEACIILKAGYSWVSSDAEDSPDGAPKGMLRLEWMLTFDSFNGSGAMGRCRLKVKNDLNWQDISEEEERDEAEWNRAVRQYQRDGNYVPPLEE